jgi:hypothetical protein
MCLRSPARASACRLIVDYFEAIDGGEYRRACALLGWELRLETGGRECPSVLAFSRGTPFQVMGARAVPHGIAVTVKVGLQELDHYRMLSWRALVARETGRLRILETRLVAT